MARIASCPNCGAPLRPTEPNQTICSYCRSHIVLEAKTPPLPLPAAPRAPRYGREAAIVAVIVVLVVIGAATALTALRAAPQSAKGVPARPAGRAAATVPTRPGVPLAQLGTVDVTLSADAAKVAMPRDFPEAATDVHRIEYTFRIEHPAFNRAVVVWEWGCNCLSHVHVDLRSHALRERAPQSFVPCVDERLGAATASQPPFSYEWDRGGKLPELSLRQALRVDLARGGEQVAWQDLLGVIDACGRELADGAAAAGTR